ncbi:MAG: VCBS repeat-containing protein, partial [Actinomycetota bacterium]|nr:VCBS repeat-containing protein [Actinomycetota bacterium]
MDLSPAPGSPLITGDAVYGFTTGDFNDDGFDDVATVGETRNIHVRLGSADGMFTPAPGSPFGTASTGSRHVAVHTGYFNDDDSLDLLAAHSEEVNSYETYLGAGDGSFPAAPDFTVTLPNSGPPSYYGAASPVASSIGDLNKDGHPDLIVGMERPAIDIALGNSDGSFTAQPGPIEIPETRFLDSMNTTTTGDYNGDGNLDIAMTMDGQASSGLYVANGSGNGGITPAANNPLQTEPKGQV